MPDLLTRTTQGALRSGAAVLFGSLSALRHDRIFHPQGVAYRATLRPAGPAGSPVRRMLRGRRSAPAIVRLSRGAGLPQRLPDVLGLAIKVPEVQDSGGDQDLLLVSSGARPLTRHLLLPAIGWFETAYSSILPFDVGGERVLVGARALRRPRRAGGAGLDDLVAATARGPVTFELLVAGLVGPWRRVGVLELGARLTDDVSERLRFNPWNTGGGIRPAGTLNSLRDAAYRASQSARVD